MKINWITEDYVELHGLLYKTTKKTQEVILAVHGMSSNCMKRREEVIANEANKNNIDYVTFNNRGHDLACYINKYVDGKKTKVLGGTAFEDVLDSSYDIVGGILKLRELGYTKIHLQGHSLGCTKIVYTYNQLIQENKKDILESVASVILLSMVDIYEAQKYFLQDKFKKVLEIAEEKEKQGREKELLPMNSFIHPVSAKTYLRYFRDNEKLQFPKYAEKENQLPELNQISQPIFMRWGNVNELIIQPVEELVNIVTTKLQNPNKNISYIDGAGHNYGGKEEILAREILSFIMKNKE